METINHIQLRDARDRMIDLLGIGKTFPLRDLPIRDEQLTVTYKTTAIIPIDYSQIDVRYQLYDDYKPVNRKPIGDGDAETPIEKLGNGGTIELETDEIEDDITFQVRAQKQRSGKAKYLHETATIKVGLDTELRAWIKNVDHLDPEIKDPQDTNARIAAYGVEVEIEIALSQEGVDYRLVSLGPGTKETELCGRLLFQTPLTTPTQLELDERKVPESLITEFNSHKISLSKDVIVGVEAPQETWVIRIGGNEQGYLLKNLENKLHVFSLNDRRGNLRNILLTTEPVLEDLDIRIRATKIFDASEKRESQTDLLKVTLPLKIQANPAVAVTPAPTPIVDYEQSAGIKIANTQSSAVYQLYIRSVPDSDFIHTHKDNIDIDTVEVTVSNEHIARIRKPAQNDDWKPLNGFKTYGDPLPGNGGELQFSIKKLSSDSIVVVQGLKEHQNTPMISSAVQIQQAAVILVRPNPAPSLRIRAILEGSKTNGELTCFDGQAGVFYNFHLTPTGKDLGKLPAYFHKRDDQDPNSNKGLEELTIGVDYVIARSLPSTNRDTSSNLAEIPPLPPLLETEPILADSLLHIHALKAQSRVATALKDTVTIKSVSNVKVQDKVVDYNQSTKIIVVASNQGERYQPFLNGTPLKQALNGNDKDLSFLTGNLIEDAEFEMLVTPSNPKGTFVERVVKLKVGVRPKKNLPVSTSLAIIDFSHSTSIQVETSQVGVKYQLTVAGKAVSDGIGGNAGTITLQSDPLPEDTIFIVRAIKVLDPEIFAELAQKITVQVLPNPALTVKTEASIVDKESTTKVLVENSQAGVNYQLMVKGIPVGDPVKGNAKQIVLPSGPLSEETTFKIRASKIANADISLELEQQVVIRVRPDPTLTVSAVTNGIAKDAEAEIRIEKSQIGVIYQLTLDGEAHGDSVPGDGATIILRSASVTEDLTFTIRAIAASDTEVFIDLKQKVSIKIEAPSEAETEPESGPEPEPQPETEPQPEPEPEPKPEADA